MYLKTSCRQMIRFILLTTGLNLSPLLKGNTLFSGIINSYFAILLTLNTTAYFDGKDFA